MRRFVWMTLQLASVLSLTACFTFIDFDLDDGAGGATTGGAPGTGGEISSGGSPPMGGGGEGGTGGAGGRPIAMPCEEWCDTTCIADACQPLPYFNADQFITALGVGGDQVVIMEQDVLSPAEPAEMKFLPANAGGLVSSPTNVIGSAPGGYWNAGQGWIAVDPVTGDAYYSPQGAATDNPVLVCNPSSDCQLAFDVPAVANERSHLNSLTFFEGKVYGINPITGRVWTAAPNDAQASIAFDLVLADGSGDGVPAGHDVAFGADRVVASSLGAPAPGAPCVGIGTVQLLINPGDTLDCPALDPMYLNVSSPSVADDGDVYYRVYLDGKPQLKGITLRDHNGQVETPFNDFELPVDSMNNGIGGVLADAFHVYFFADVGGLFLLRCDLGGGNESCVQTSGNLVLPGLMAANDNYLFFSSGSQLFRLAKPPNP